MSVCFLQREVVEFKDGSFRKSSTFYNVGVGEEISITATTDGTYVQVEWPIPRAWHTHRTADDIEKAVTMALQSQTTGAIIVNLGVESRFATDEEEAESPLLVNKP